MFIAIYRPFGKSFESVFHMGVFYRGLLKVARWKRFKLCVKFIARRFCH